MSIHERWGIHRHWPEIACVLDAAGDVMFVNPAFEVALGWSNGELEGMPFRSLVHVDDAAAATRWIAQLSGSVAAPSVALWMRRSHGECVRISWHGGKAGDQCVLSGRFTGEVAPDVTAASALTLDPAMLLNILPHCVIAIDAAGMIVASNDAVEAVFGYRPVEVIGGNVRMLMPEPARSAPDAVFAGYLGGHNSVIGLSVEVEGRHRSGQPIPLELFVEECIANAQQYFVGVVRDNVEGRRLITELTRARVEAEQANQAKSAFLAAMSHEIRTPMNGVIGMLEVLSQSRLDPAQSDAVATIGDSATALLGLLDDILDFSKIEADLLAVEVEPVVLAALAESVCETLSASARAREVQMSLFVDPTAPERIHTDPMRLRQILLNLVGNAIKFSASRPGHQGRVAIRLRVIEGTPSQLVAVIADNGIGMPVEKLTTLFDPFTQAERSTTRRYGGSGLGLAISKRLTGLLGGSINVASRPGVGSAFTVTIPTLTSPPPEPERLLDGIDCIVIPGQRVDADDYRAYLEHAGARVELAADAPALRSTSEDMVRPVVIQAVSASTEWSGPVRAVAAEIPHAAHLLMTSGRRRQARRQTSGVVMLDGDVLRRECLLQAVLLAAGRTDADTAARPSRRAAALVAPTVAEARAQSRLILVAEDDEVNQKVIRRQLELLGYAAEIAPNGIDALRLWQSGGHAMILSDLHMPLMDGYELARAVRAAESDGARIPILAITANALRGEAVNAHAAGMDAYLTKPIRLHELETAVAQWLRAPGRTARPATSGSAAVDPSRFDLGVLRALVGDDAETLSSLIEDYRGSALRALADLWAAHAEGDAAGLAAIAHRLKSSSRAVGAVQVGELCAALESAGGGGDAARIDTLMPELADAIEVVAAAIGASWQG
jgi:PAS domain S-box-containing protein